VLQVDHDGKVLEASKGAPDGGVQKLAGGCFCCDTGLNTEFKSQVNKSLIWSLVRACASQSFDHHNASRAYPPEVATPHAQRAHAQPWCPPVREQRRRWG
jgi:hypothetical protein